MLHPNARSAAVPSRDPGITVQPPSNAALSSVLAPEALSLAADLARRFRATRDELLKLRDIRQREIDSGVLPRPRPETAWVRETRWAVAPPPEALRDARVHVTVPAGRAAIEEALRAGADAVVVDFDDATAPGWNSCLQGHAVVRDVVHGALLAEAARRRRRTRRPIPLVARTRGLHADERRMRVDDEAVPAAFFDLALFAYHNAREMLARGGVVCVGLSKLESHGEARLWNEALGQVEQALGLRPGTFRVVVPVETVLAAFEIEEIFHELRSRVVGTGVGACGYAFNWIKRFRNQAEALVAGCVRPTAAETPVRPLGNVVLSAAARRRVPAIGDASGWSITDAASLEAACRELDWLAAAGYTGVLVSDGGLTDVARATFAAGFGAGVTEVPEAWRGLLSPPQAIVTATALGWAVSATYRYLRSLLGGQGRVAVSGHLVDAATADVARAQLWHWLRHRARTEDGVPVTQDRVRGLLSVERAGEAGDDTRSELAAKLLVEAVTRDDFPEFLSDLAAGYIP